MTDTDTDLDGLDIDFAKMNVSLKIETHDLSEHIQNKITKLALAMTYANLKFANIRGSFRIYSISIIYLATSLTLIEALINILTLEELIHNNVLIKIIEFTPLLLSSLISLLGAMIKFNRFEEKIENMTSAIEKCIANIAKLKYVKQELYLYNDKAAKIIEIKKNFNKDVYREYLDCSILIKKQLLESDNLKYKKIISNCELKKQEVDLIEKRRSSLLNKKYEQPISDISQVKIEISKFDTNAIISKAKNCFKFC